MCSVRTNTLLQQNTVHVQYRKYFNFLPLNIDSKILRDYVHLNFQIRNTLRTIVMDEEWPKHVLSDKSHNSHSLFEKYIAKSIITFCLGIA